MGAAAGTRKVAAAANMRRERFMVEVLARPNLDGLRTEWALGHELLLNVDRRALS